MDILKKSDYEEIIRRALREDAPGGDVTTISLFSETDTGSARLIAKSPGVIAGMAVAAEVFYSLQPDFVFDAQHRDGEHLNTGDVISRLRGNTRAQTGWV